MAKKKIRAGRDIDQSTNETVVHGPQYNARGTLRIGRGGVTGAGARKCTSCGGTNGWEISNGKTRHTGCGAVQ